MHGSIADPFKSATGVVTGRDYRTAAALATLTGDLYLAPNLDTLLAQAVRFVSVAITCDCAAVVLWPSHGAERWLVAGSDPRAVRAEYLQRTPGDGSRRSRSQPVTVDDTPADVSTELGLHRVMSSVIRARHRDIGVLDIYAGRRDAFRMPEQAVAGALATHIAVAVSTVTTADTLIGAIDAHTTIGQATGILMERLDVGADEALALLRRQSQDHNVKLRSVAADLVSGTAVPGDRRCRRPISPADREAGGEAGGQRVASIGTVGAATS